MRSERHPERYASQHPGVYRANGGIRGKPWGAQVWRRGRTKYLGTFMTEREAAAAVRAARYRDDDYEGDE